MEQMVERRINIEEREMFDKAKERKIQAIKLLLLNNNKIILNKKFFTTTISNGQKYGNTTFKEVSLLRGHIKEFENKLNIKIIIDKDDNIIISKI